MFRALRLVVALLCLLVVGCSTPPAADLSAAPDTPEDLAIDLTIRCGDDVPYRPESHLRPQRLVLFADGSLYYGDPILEDKVQYGPDWLPGFERLLNRQQVRELWSLLQENGLTDPTLTSDSINLSLVPVDPDEIVYLMNITAEGQRWSIVHSFAVGEALDPVAVSVVRELCEIAWVSDLPPHAVRIQPRRYHFGPDPYVRYRDNQ